MNNIDTKKGFVIFFSMLIIGLLLGVGIAISSLSKKQVTLASLSKQSQVAFYTADSGVECARYWDTKHHSFDQPGSIVCNNQTFSVGITRDATNPNATVSEFKVNYMDTAQAFIPAYAYCAEVRVIKDTVTTEVHIVSRGYNTACDAGVSARKVERAIDVTY